MENVLPIPIIEIITLFLDVEDYKNWMSVSKIVHKIVCKVAKDWKPDSSSIDKIRSLPYTMARTTFKDLVGKKSYEIRKIDKDKIFFLSRYFHDQVNDWSYLWMFMHGGLFTLDTTTFANVINAKNTIRRSFDICALLVPFCSKSSNNFDKVFTNVCKNIKLYTEFFGCTFQRFDRTQVPNRQRFFEICSDILPVIKLFDVYNILEYKSVDMSKVKCMRWEETSDVERLVDYFIDSGLSLYYEEEWLNLNIVHFWLRFADLYMKDFRREIMDVFKGSNTKRLETMLNFFTSVQDIIEEDPLPQFLRHVPLFDDTTYPKTLRSNLPNTAVIKEWICETDSWDYIHHILEHEYENSIWCFDVVCDWVLDEIDAGHFEPFLEWREEESWEYLIINYIVHTYEIQQFSKQWHELCAQDGE